MNFHKVCILFLLMTILPSSAYWNVGVFLPVNVRINVSQKMLVTGAAIGGSVLAAYGLYRLYNYFCVMTLPKAEKLCNEVSTFIEKTTSKYYDEFALIDSGMSDADLKVELQNIITNSDSESPYMSYTNALRSSADQAKAYEDKYSRGIPQLQCAMEKVLSQIENMMTFDLAREGFELQLQNYKNIFHTIAQLRELLHAVRFKMQRMIRLCVQFDAYRQEQMLQQLQAIQTQLMLNNCRH